MKLTDLDAPGSAAPAPLVAGINLQNEGALHAALKQWCAQPGDLREARVDGAIIDIVRGDPAAGGLLIEVQTRQLGAIGAKLRRLAAQHRVTLVYPIALEKWIVVTAPDGAVLRRRRSPKRGRLLDLFDELVRIADLATQPNFALEVLLIREEEARCDDGRGSWRRKGISIEERRLLDVVERVTLRGAEDYRRFLPPDLPQPFSNRDLAAQLDLSIHTARRMSYALAKMGLIRRAGKRGRGALFEII